MRKLNQELTDEANEDNLKPTAEIKVAQNVADNNQQEAKAASEAGPWAKAPTPKKKKANWTMTEVQNYIHDTVIWYVQKYPEL